MSLSHLAALAKLAGRCADELEPQVERYAALVRRALQGGGTLYFAGNGGSAAHAQHVATEYVVRYQANRKAARALALSTDSSLLTAAANDIGFDTIFARQVEAHGRAGDLLVVISTSGTSVNCIKAVEAARAHGMATVALLARDGGRLKGMVDVAVIVPTDDTALAQEVQLAIDHHVCSLIEPEL